MPAVRERIQPEIRLTDFCRSVHQNSTDEQARKVNSRLEETQSGNGGQSHGPEREQSRAVQHCRTQRLKLASLALGYLEDTKRSGSSMYHPTLNVTHLHTCVPPTDPQPHMHLSLTHAHAHAHTVGVEGGQ